MPDFATGYVWLNIIIFAAGLTALIKGSDWFVEAAVAIAKRLNIPHIIIGLTLVSIGTSLPELGTDVYASIQILQGTANAGNIIAGDIVGSNITNISLVLGLGIVLMGGIKTPRQLLKRDVSFMFGVFVLLPVAVVLSGSNPGHINRIWGLILLTGLIGYVFFLFKHPEKVEEMEEEDAEETGLKSLPVIWLAFFAGLILIFAGAKASVDNVLKVASQLGLNTAMVSATVVALGTSLPELAVTITGAVKKKHSLALGNIVGSCTFNILLIIGVCSIISPIPINHGMLYFNIPIMIVCGALLALFMRTKWKLEKLEGIILLLIYLAFFVCNILKMKSH